MLGRFAFLPTVRSLDERYPRCLLGDNTHDDILKSIQRRPSALANT